MKDGQGGFTGMLRSRRGDIAERFTDRLYETAVPVSVDRVEAEDSVAEFLEDLAERIDASANNPSGGVPSPNATAAEHGKQRFGMGYDIGAVIREYATLRDVIWEFLEEEACEVTPRELGAFSKHLVSSIADAAARYAHERDEEVARQTKKHIGFLAHELRNPLGSMKMALSLLKRTGDLPASRGLAVIDRSMTRLAERIDNALVDVRLHAGAQLEPERFSLPQLLQEIIDDSLPDADSRGQKLRLEVGEGDLYVEADRNLLLSALSNLVRNAVKFSRDGETIHVRVRMAQARVLIEVEDGCGGLPPGSVQKLFDPFVQAGKDRSGFGLGLAIAKQAVEAHRGELRVHSIDSKGCVFMLDIPVQHQTLGGGMGK